MGTIEPPADLVLRTRCLTQSGLDTYGSIRAPVLTEHERLYRRLMLVGSGPLRGWKRPPVCCRGYRRIVDLLPILRRYGRKQGNGGTRTLGFEFQAKTLSRSGKRTALFLDRQIKAARFPQTSGLDVFSAFGLHTACFATAGAYLAKQHAIQIQRPRGSSGCRGKLAVEAGKAGVRPVQRPWEHRRHPTALSGSASGP
jgi:hypothetical protein